MAKESAKERVDTLEQVLIDVWNEAQDCDGSRGEQQAALDKIQSLIEEEMSDVADYEASDSSDESEESDESDSD